jgi:serine/threonine protein kinase
LERFFREAQIAAGLHHTNIVPVFDVGQVGGRPYYAMQYIRGKSLENEKCEMKTAEKENPSGVPNFQSSIFHFSLLARQAALALAYAHARGVIHRDIKPANLILDDQGTLWVTDFGLARRLDDATLTADGQLLGTPRYMSPEQAEAATSPIDHRTDLYSLGVTLYELWSAGRRTTARPRRRWCNKS